MAIPVDDDFLIEIGRSAHLFHNLHEMVCMALSNICAKPSRHNVVHQCLSAFTSFKTSVGMLEALYRNFSEDDDATKEMEAIIKEIRRLGALRNNVTHSSWLPGGGGDWIQWKPKKDRDAGVKVKGDVYTVEQLQNLNEEIDKVSNALTSFIFKDNKRGNKVFHVEDNGVIGKPKRN